MQVLLICLLLMSVLVFSITSSPIDLLNKRGTQQFLKLVTYDRPVESANNHQTNSVIHTVIYSRGISGIDQKSLEILSSKTSRLETKLYKGYLGFGGQILAKFAYGLDESKIWSINVIVDDMWNNLVPPNYRTSVSTVFYTWYCAGGFFHIQTTEVNVAVGIALKKPAETQTAMVTSPTTTDFTRTFLQNLAPLFTINRVVHPRGRLKQSREHTRFYKTHIGDGGKTTIVRTKSKRLQQRPLSTKAAKILMKDDGELGGHLVTPLLPPKTESTTLTGATIAKTTAAGEVGTLSSP
ncbi:unnamed protein product [Didymodactylos carnosus]|uniref:Uncharacterized protein n=1 Tax=Didymodactylos carnosus TaxID=1234261 RepID=A0A814UKW3_9BILA|nr:unnamed protein product [Didymodactylos carnosus]CAF1455830.1 unnamed protein product [Didymodactylos carnosus]CAF3938764.1 unnamed protein product [Didymodactylos carnosus]CAF4249926.1 unnamed protein product [Didymodactylos carnosus]